MFDLVMERVFGRLQPADAWSEELFDDVPFGKHLRVRITEDRSGPQHRLFFKCLGHVAKGCGQDPERLRKVILLETGYVDIVKRGGKVWEIPKSMRFDKMPQAEFNRFFNDAMALIADEVGMKQPALMRELRQQFPSLFAEVITELAA